jgi:hypothetical protein
VAEPSTDIIVPEPGSVEALVQEARENGTLDLLTEELVETTIGRGWNLASRNRLALVLGLSGETLDHFKTRALTRAAKYMSEQTPGEARAELVLRARYASALALSDGEYGSLARLMAVEMRLRQMDAVEVRVGHVPQTTPEQLLAARRRVAGRLRESMGDDGGE